MLDELQRKYPNYKFILLIGEDNLNDFTLWKNYEYILEKYKVFVHHRNFENENNTYFPFDLNKYKTISIINSNNIIDISSTKIRENIKKGISIDNMVPKSIIKKIIKYYKQ